MTKPWSLPWSDSVSAIVSQVSREAWRNLRPHGWALDDVEQELRLHLLERIDRYCHDRGSLEAFATTALRYHAVTLLRSERALKRGGGAPTMSLDGVGEPKAPPDETPEIFLSRMVMNDLFESLPEESRRWAEAARDKGIAGAARQLGLGRRASERHRDALRAGCRRLGLDPKQN